MNTKLIAAAIAVVSISTANAQARPTPEPVAQNGRYISNNDGHYDFVVGPTAGNQASTRKLNTHRAAHRIAKGRETHQFASNGESGSGIIRSAKTGATARVAPRYASRFQAYIDDLEAHGAAIYYMGGYRPGQCSKGSQHPCGKALDVCQDSRGHVSGLRDCHLPSPTEMARIAEAHDLHEGAVWCNTDYGHAQVEKTGSDCTPSGWAGNGRGHYLASMTGRIQFAAARHHRHHRRRYASR